MAAVAFEDAVELGIVHQLAQADFATSKVSSAELQKTYTTRMVPAGSPGRPIYDELKLAASHGVCPSCGQRVVSTLDHYLPKTYYPLLSVVPTNLVPVCSDCNHAKRDSYAASEDEVPLHPYFDEIDADSWLVAEVVAEEPPAAIFQVQAPESWSPVLRSRVRRHFERHALAELYTAQAAVELAGIETAIQRAHERGGTEAVEQHLNDQVAGRELAHRNSWQAALYRALACSGWYCSDRFG